MHGVLEGLKNVAVVMDDILVWGTTIQEHDANLKNLLERCERHDLKLNLKKCHFLQDQVRYLGHILTTEGLSLDPERVEDILAVPEPRDLSDARLHDILQATENDAAFIQLREYASASWPAEKRDVPEELRTYWNYRDEMHVEDGLVFRSNKVIKELRQSTASSVVSACAEVFATHGIPAKLCSDNGPPFNSYNFKDFVSKFRIIHVTSSPHHPRSNGMAERAVQEAKKLLTRCSYDTLDFCSALLEWRNSPRDNLLKSPVQRLMGRQTRTLLPVPDCCLEPAIVPPKEVHKRLQEIRSKQRTFYNRTKALPELQDGQQVSAFDTISHTWSPAVVMRRAGPPRSFVIETGDGRVLRRTREHLRVLPPRQQQLVTTAAAESTGRQVREEPSTGAPPSQDPPTQELRRSSRQRRSPVRYPRPEL
ncbi:uncharacterized protein LOC115313654 isoform X1 [Ixodes scapularis]|nr:uncharacterized protein LOC115313654 isoform X1 [Ixodes scapularis]